MTALEEGALDAARLARGRGYAEQGHVDAVTVTPGLVLAYVQGSRPRPYRVQVRLRSLGDDDWQRFLDAAVERPGHIAALLDGELPHTLADCGVPLLPGPATSRPGAAAPTRATPASTPQRSATRRRGSSTPTPSSCSCSAAGANGRCSTPCPG